ncbi:MAG: hypothetical protein ACRDQ2_01475 [Gaiellales bacterium]
MLYLYVLFTKEHLAMLGDEERRNAAVAQIAQAYGDQFNTKETKVLGSEVRDGPLPSEADSSVTDAFFAAAARHGVTFQSDEVRVGYSIGQLGGTATGICLYQPDESKDAKQGRRFWKR